MNLSENHTALQKRISLYITALQNEIEGLRNYSSRNYSLSAGKFLGNSEAEFLYEFRLDDDARMGDDVPVEIEIDGDIVRGNMVNVEGEKIVLLLQTHFGDIVEHATLRTAPFFLLEQLIDRLESIEDEDTGCVEALFDEDAGIEFDQDLTIDRKGLNEFQVNAARSVASKQVSFVWGPPGTGKTLTLSYAAANLI